MTDGEPRLRLGLAAAVATIAGLETIRLLVWSPVDLAAHGFFRDDTLFYTVLARNFATYGFLTFDGSMPTSGVQPGWMGLLIAVGFLLPDADSLAMAAVLSWGAFVAFAFTATWLVARGPAAEAIPRTVVFAAIVPLNFCFHRFAVQGIETPLLLLLISLLLIAIERAAAQRDVSLRSALGIAALCTACFFARTDQFWIWLVVTGWLVDWKGLAFSRLLSGGVLSAVFILPYLANNWLTHGSPVPISGRVKSFYMESALPTLPDWLGSEEWFGPFSAFAQILPAGKDIPIGVVAPLVLLLGFWLLRRARDLPTGLVVVGVATLFQVFFMLFFYREVRPRNSYYFAGTVVLAAWSLAWLAPRIAAGWSARGRRIAGVGAAALVAASAAAALVPPSPSNFWRSGIALAKDIDALPVGATVGGFFPGAIAQFSRRGVKPLDGIVGSQRYFEEAVKQGDQLEALVAEPRPHLAVYLSLPPDELFALEELPDKKWSRFFEKLLWEYRACPMEVVARRLREGDEKRWYLLRLGWSPGDRCRQR